MENDKNDPEYTMTKSEWEEMQLKFDITLDGRITSLTDEERADLEAEIGTLNADAIKKAISGLILRHPVEFHALLRHEREKHNITMQVNSEFVKALAIAGKNA